MPIAHGSTSATYNGTPHRPRSFGSQLQSRATAPLTIALIPGTTTAIAPFVTLPPAGPAHQPVDQDRFGKPLLAVKAWNDIVPRRQYLARGLAVAGLVAVPER